MTFTTVGNTLFFSADDGSSGSELWKSDGTAEGTVQVADIYPGTDSSYPIKLTAIGDTCSSQRDDGSSGYELWKSRWHSRRDYPSCRHIPGNK